MNGEICQPAAYMRLVAGKIPFVTSPEASLFSVFFEPPLRAAGAIDDDRNQLTFS